MLKELYCKHSNDPTLQDNILEHSDVYEAILSKIRMILYTRKGDVLGEPGFGTSIEDYVFETNVSGEDLKRMINEQIVTYIPEYDFFNITIDIKFQKGRIHDTCFIDIKINGTPAIGILLE